MNIAQWHRNCDLDNSYPVCR